MNDEPEPSRCWHCRSSPATEEVRISTVGQGGAIIASFCRSCMDRVLLKVIHRPSKRALRNWKYSYSNPNREYRT